MGAYTESSNLQVFDSHRKAGNVHIFLAHVYVEEIFHSEEILALG